MAKFTKAVLKVGETMQSPDGPVPITAERLSHFAEQHKKLTASGYSVPSRWEHADKPEDMIPLATADIPAKLDGRHAVGYMADFQYRPGSGQAELTLAVSDARASEQCEANRVKVSPIIAKAWKDGRGNLYTDFISHADLVERPVDYSQGDFKKVPETIACSLERYVDLDALKLAAEEADDAPPDAASEEAPESPPAEPAKNPDAPPKATDKSKLTAVLDGLKTKGIVLPSDFDFTSDSAIDVMLAAINSSVAADVKREEDEQASKEEDKPPTVASPGYAAMSTETKAAVEYATRIHRERITERLDGLLKQGRCTPDEHKKQSEGVGVVRLSLDNENKPLLSDLEKWIASREPLPAGTFWTPEQRTRLSAEAQVAELPEDMRGGELSDEDGKARAMAQLKRSGFPVKA